MTALSIYPCGGDKSQPNFGTDIAQPAGFNGWPAACDGPLAFRGPDVPVIDLVERLAARDAWRIGPDVAPLRIPTRDAERVEEDPERWDGLS